MELVRLSPRDAEPLRDERGVLQRVALGDSLVGEPAQVERFVRERVRGPARAELVVAARGAVETREVDAIELPELRAGLRREIGVITRTAVGVEVDAARLPVRVDEASEEARTPHADVPPRDLRGDRAERILLSDPVFVRDEAGDEERRGDEDKGGPSEGDPHPVEIGLMRPVLDAVAGGEEAGPSARLTPTTSVEGGKMAKLGEKQRRFLAENPYVGTVTTLREDGSPHSTVVWVDVDEGTVSFNTARGRAKPRHLEHDPRASLLVVDPNDPYRWVAVEGHAELTEQGADAQIDKLAKKYLGKDDYPFRKADEQRVSVRILPEHVDSSGFGDD